MLHFEHRTSPVIPFDDFLRRLLRRLLCSDLAGTDQVLVHRFFHVFHVEEGDER
jgi:hypothetical protein